MASWSKTYGTTDETIPTPMPAARATASTNAGAALQPASGVTQTAASSIAARPSIRPTRDPREAVGEDDVEREQPGVDESKDEADGLAFKLDIGQEIDAEHGEREGGCVPWRSGTERGQPDHGEELDRRDGSERQPVDRDVETTFISAKTAPRASTTFRPSRSIPARRRQGRRQRANTAAALAIRSHATPRGSTRAKSSTAKAGPR